jgi:hypothetical protein
MSDKIIYVADSQILNTVSECSRKANFTFDQNLEPIVKPDYFETGDMLHQMLAGYYKLRKYRSRWRQNNKTHADIVDICNRIGRQAALKMSLEVDTVEEVESTFRQYSSHTSNDGWDNIAFVEEVASKILYEDDRIIILYQGKIDLGLYIGSTLLPVDHKSSKRRQRPSILSNQFRGYCWLLDVNSIIINKIGFQKTLAPNEKFERHTLSYCPEIIEEWKEFAIYWIRKYIAEQEANYFPPNNTSCDKYAGCIYLDVCTKPPELRKQKLVQLFKEKDVRWDVGKD